MLARVLAPEHFTNRDHAADKAKARDGGLFEGAAALARWRLTSDGRLKPGWEARG
jgi:hypothetical protein